MQAPTIQIIPQRTSMDCAVACLAMLCGVEYEMALSAFNHNVSAKGANTRQICKAAKRLNRDLHYTKQVRDLEDATGILCVASTRWPNDHVVVLKEGQIVDTDFTLWDADVYLTTYRVTVAGIFTLREDR